MVLLLLGLLIALLPLILTTAFPHLVIVSIYIGLAHVIALAWAMLVIGIIVRKHRISAWREAKKQSKQESASQKGQRKIFG